VIQFNNFIRSISVKESSVINVLVYLFGLVGGVNVFSFGVLLVVVLVVLFLVESSRVRRL